MRWALLALMGKCLAEGARYCNAGEKVWLRRDDFGLSPLRGTVLRRWPGQAEVLLEESNLHVRVPINKLRTRFGHFCACVALCLFGRVGNLEGKFDEAGSSEDALAISAASVWEHVVRANSEMRWDIFAHTWDEDLHDAIQQAYRPRKLHSESNVSWLPVEGFGESLRRSSELRREEEIQGDFRYDLVVVMRYDILFRRPLKLVLDSDVNTLWSSHWCSVHAEDFSVREIVVASEEELLLKAPDPRYHGSGVFAPSQFAPGGLHDFWFAAASETMDSFAQWGAARPRFLEHFGMPSQEVPLDVGHFHSYLHALELGLQLSFTGISYVDFTLVRYRGCELDVGEEISSPDWFCLFWEVSITRRCDSWLPTISGWAHHFCPIAGRRASLKPGGYGCGRF